MTAQPSSRPSTFGTWAFERGFIDRDELRHTVNRAADTSEDTTTKRTPEKQKTRKKKKSFASEMRALQRTTTHRFGLVSMIRDIRLAALFVTNIKARIQMQITNLKRLEARLVVHETNSIRVDDASDYSARVRRMAKRRLAGYQNKLVVTEQRDGTSSYWDVSWAKKKKRDGDDDDDDDDDSSVSDA